MKKKLITGILATLACFACFGGAACNKDKGDNSSSSEVVIDLDAAKAFADDQFRLDHAETREDYEFPNTILFDGVTYNLSWSVNVTSGVTVTREETKTKFDVNEELENDLEYQLTLTIADPNDAENVATIVFNRTVLAQPQMVLVAIAEAPVEGTAYKFHMYQENRKEDLFLNGQMSSFYYATTQKQEEAIDIYVENTTDGFYMYHTTENDAKKYLNIVASGDYNNVKYEDEKKSVWTWDAEFGVLTTVGEKTFFLGTYDQNKTFSACDKDKRPTNFKGRLSLVVDRKDVPAANRVEKTAEELSFAPVYVGENTLTLAQLGTTYPDTTIAWTVTGSDAASIADGKLVLTDPTASADLTLTATITNGDKNATKAFTIHHAKNDEAGIVAALDKLESGQTFGNEVSLTGVVTGFDNNGAYVEKFGNITVYMSVGGKSLLAYHMEGVGVNEVTAGYEITVAGMLTNYSGTLEFTDCRMTAGEYKEANIQTATVADINTAVADYEKNQYSTELYSVTGTIVEIETYAPKADKYPNELTCEMTIADANGDLLFVYGAKAKNGQMYYQMETQPAVGDKVTLVSVAGKFYDAQLKDANIFELVASTPVSDKAKLAHEKYFLDTETTISASGDVTLPAVAKYSDVTLTWTSNNAAAVVAADYSKVTYTLSATQDIEVTLTATLAIGETTMTKTFDVLLEQQLPAGQAKAGFVSSNLGLENAAVFASKTVKDVTFTASKGEGSNDPKYYNSGSALRIYGKNSFVISVPTGYKIVTVTITTIDTGKLIKADNCTITGASAGETLGTANVVLTADADVNTITLLNKNTSGNFQIASISVIYEALPQQA